MKIDIEELGVFFSEASPKAKTAFEDELFRRLRACFEGLNDAIAIRDQWIDASIIEETDLEQLKMTNRRRQRLADVRNQKNRLWEERAKYEQDRQDFIVIIWALSAPFACVSDPADSEFNIAAIEEAIAARRTRQSTPDENSAPVRGRLGRPAIKLDEAVAKMQEDINTGLLTRDQLASMLLKQLEHKYRVHRDTAARARDRVLGGAEIRPADAQPSAVAENGEKSIVEFPTGKKIR
jgi:hypothetical protein